LQAIKRLDDQARRVDAAVEGFAFSDYLNKERIDSPLFGGRTV
jgi:hypothetical protein